MSFWRLPAIAVDMYNFRARVRPSVIGSVRSPAKMRGQALPWTIASQVTPSQALEILSEVTTVAESEVPLVESEQIEEASMPPVLVRELDRSFASTRDTPVNLDDSLYALVPVAAVSAAGENNTTLTDTLRIDSRDTRDVSEVSSNTKNPILTLAPQLVNKDLQAQRRLGSSSENRYGEVLRFLHHIATMMLPTYSKLRALMA